MAIDENSLKGMNNIFTIQQGDEELKFVSYPNGVVRIETDTATFVLPPEQVNSLTNWFRCWGTQQARKEQEAREHDLLGWTRGPDEVLGEVEGEQWYWCATCARHRPHSHFPHKEIVERQVEQQEPTEPCYVCGAPVSYVSMGNGEEAAPPMCTYCNRVICSAHGSAGETGYLCCVNPKCRGEDITDAQAEQIKADEDKTEQHLELGSGSTPDEADDFLDCGY